MNLLIIAPHTSIHVIKRITHLFKTKHQIHLASPVRSKVFLFNRDNWDSRKRIIDQYFRNHKKEVLLFNLFRFFFRGSLHQLFFGFFYYKKQLIKIIQTVKPSVVNGHIASSFGFWGAITGTRPYILTVWGSDILYYPKRSIFYYLIVKYTLKCSDAVLTDGLNIADELKKHISDDRIRFVPFGIRLKRGREVEKKRDKKFVYILSARALEPIYRINRIIELFSCIKGDRYRLTIANDGSQKRRLEQLVKKLKITDKVHFTGTLEHDKLIEIYKQSDLFIAFPRSDGTSVTLLEAMYYGLIPVLNNIKANQFWINDQENGFLIDPDNRKETLHTVNYILMNTDRLKKKIAKINKSLIRKKAVFEKNMELEIKVLKEA